MEEQVVTQDIFENLKKIREELDEVIESIDIMNDENLMKGITRAKEDVKAGRVHELKGVEQIFEK